LTPPSVHLAASGGGDLAKPELQHLLLEAERGIDATFDGIPDGFPLETVNAAISAGYIHSYSDGWSTGETFVLTKAGRAYAGLPNKKSLWRRFVDAIAPEASATPSPTLSGPQDHIPELLSDG